MAWVDGMESVVKGRAVDEWALALFRLRDAGVAGISERSTFTMHLVPRAAVDSKRVWNWLADPMSRPDNMDIVHRGSAECAEGVIECMMIGWSLPRGLAAEHPDSAAARARYRSLVASFDPAQRLESADIGFGDRRSYELFRADARQSWGPGTYEIVTGGEGFHTRLLALAESHSLTVGPARKTSASRAL